MSINNQVPIVPLVPGVASADEVGDAEIVDGDEKRLDPDANPDNIDSAEADRRAAGADDGDSLLGS